jgi:hypothetical protein
MRKEGVRGFGYMEHISGVLFGFSRIVLSFLPARYLVSMRSHLGGICSVQWLFSLSCFSMCSSRTNLCI